ncbi:MAG: histidinol-phosphate transaminase [Candidatus Nanopelagicales bacterium]
MTSVGDLPIRDDLRDVEAYGAPQLDVTVRLNTNENPHPPGPEVIAAITDTVARVAGTLQRYPDRDAVVLRRTLASYLTEQTGVLRTPAQLWAANGSNEILQQLMQLFAGPGRQVLGFEPSYSMHPLIARGTGSSYTGIPRAADFSVDVGGAVAAIRELRPDVVMVCSPNNPTGTTVGPGVIEALYEVVAETATGVLVVDEAYAEFSNQPSAVTLLAGRPRLVVTRTMSKAFAFAGARVGYLTADAAVVEAIGRVRLPYHLSALTQAAAVAALEHASTLQSAVNDLKAQRDRIVVECVRLGCRVADSDANFVLVGGFTDQTRMWRLLVDADVLVRDVGLPGWLRATAGTQEETSAFLEALSAILEAEPGLLSQKSATTETVPALASTPDQEETA